MSISSSTTASLPAWRIAVVGAVGALAVGIGVAAGSFLLNNRVAALGSAAAYVPADAALYLELRVTPSAAQDESLRELLGRFPPIEGIDLARPLSDQLSESLDDLMAEADTGITWSGDIAPWFDGHVGMAVTDASVAMQPEPGDMIMPAVPPFVALFGVTDRSAASAAIDRMLDASDAPAFTEEAHLGTTIFVSPSGGVAAPAYALTDDQLIFGSSSDAVRAALDTKGDAAGSLAGEASLAQLAGGLPQDWLAFISFDFTELMSQALDAAGGADPAMAELFADLMEHQPLRGAMTISADGDRVVLDGRTDAPSGPFAVANADRGLADEVPGDALYYSEGGNIGPALAGVIEPLKAAMGEMPEAEAQLLQLESALGADLEEVVSWIGDGAVVVGYDGTAPYGGLVLVPTDVEAAERRIGQLITFASLGAMDPSSGLSVSEEDVDGVTVTTIRFGPMGGGGDLFPMPSFEAVIEVAVTDDRALIGVGDDFVRRALALESGDSLAAQPRFSDAIAELGGADNAGATWVDLAGTRIAVEGALGDLISGDPTYEAEVLPWIEPLDRLVSVTRLEGDVAVQRAVLLVE